ncbi:MAG TPA: response regulator [Kofleriaceae bacterium]|nr:response regulator [Kofleriaceae bacterium]
MRAITATIAAVAIAPRGADGYLRVLIERLAKVGIEVAVVDDAPGAAELAQRSPTSPPCILIDLRELTAGSDPEDVNRATEAIQRASAAIPHATPVAITGQADAALIVACIRAGAGDVIDLHLEGTAAARTVVQRICTTQAVRASGAHIAHTLRGMIDELLKDLIRTERRSIDLEERLAVAERQTGELAIADVRAPAVLLVDHDRGTADQLADRLEATGVSTFAFLSGEDAVREVDQLMSLGGAFDLAVVAEALPGMDGVETVRALRERLPGLPALLATPTIDGDPETRAAELGVVGFVHAPVSDVDSVVERVAQLARDSLQRTREQVYLERIKSRHERVLARYRSLPREP